MKQQDLFDRDMVDDSTQWIYESPDSGKTIYRRKLGSEPGDRERISTGTFDNDFDYAHFVYRQDWDELAGKHPGIKEYLDKLRMLIALVDEK